MKRILSMLLVVAILLTMIIVPVSAGTTTTAQEENITPLSDACPCGCGEKLEDVDWMPWNPTIKGSPANGHHYLTADYVQESSAYSLMIIAGTKVVIDLRGYTWTTKTAFRTMTVQGEFFLMDTVGGGKFAPKTDTTWGGAVLVDTYETANPSFTLVSGTMTMAEGSTTNSGGMVYAREDGRFIMTGGVIENCAVTGNGGAVVTAGNATVEILGGIIRNCSAAKQGGVISSAQPVTLKNATFIDCSAGTDGGVVQSSKKITVENCTFMNCSATGNGGAIYASGGVEMKDSLFLGNSANNGGDIYITGSAASKIDSTKFYGGYSVLNGGSIMANDTDLTIEDSLMMGAIADKQGGHIYQYGGSLTIKNCELTGGISNWAGSGTPYCGGGNLLVMAGKTAATTLIEDSVIRNGFAMARGGNIQLCSDTTTFTMKNTTVTGGVAKYRGNNLEAQSSMTITIDGGVIDGDVALTGSTKPITLKGNLKIGLRNNGLALGANAKVNASGLTEGAEIYMSGTGTLVAAGANPAYFKGAIRTTLSGGNDAAITGTAGTSGYCPHCLKLVDWVAFSGQTTDGHFYLTANRSSIVTHSSNTQDIVIDLAGKTVNSTSARVITSYSKAKLTLLDSVGNSKVSGNGGTATVGGGMSILNGTTYIYGGNYALSGVKETFGGVLYNRGTMYVYGGYFDGSLYECKSNDTSKDTQEKAGRGATVYVLGGKKITITAGHFVGGTAYHGGNLWAGNKATVNITGGTFVGGAGTTGGNLYMYDCDSGTGSFKVENAVIRDGTVTYAAGNIRVGKAATNTMKNCYIGGGTSTGSEGFGGNISSTASNVKMTDCVIYGGTVANKGGNIYSASTTSALTLDSCLVIGGTAATNGGNIFFNHGNHVIKGGEISFGSARIGGNMYAHAGNYSTGGSTTIQKNAKGEVTKIFNGSATYGGNLSIVGTVDLQAAEIFGGTAKEAGADIQLTRLSDAKADPKLTIGSDVTGGRTGEISMVAPAPEPIYGQPVTYTVCNGLNEKATIVLENVKDHPNVLAKDGVLVVAGAKVVDKEGNESWYANYSDAAAAAVAQGGFVKLFADTQLNLTQDTFVDLNGHSATVTGNGKLLCMDTTGDSYDLPKGKVTFEGAAPVEDKSMVHAPNGNKYVALVGDGEITFHRLGADLTSVTMNIDKNAVYFKGKFAADSKLKGLIDSYGIAVSLKGMPDESLTDAIASSYEGESLVNGVTASGVYVTNILREDLSSAENDARGRSKIYATAYVTMGDKTFTSDQTATSEDDVAWSLYDAFRRLDDLIDEDPTNFRRYTGDMRAYYEKWKDQGIAEWIDAGSNFVDPEEDDVIDVLMIGSSACYYYVEEMASLAAAAGIKLRVRNVYYSGCPIDKYYKDWLANYADYQFFDTIAEVVDGEIVATRRNRGGGKTLEWCLAQGDWDVISMQTRGGLAMRDYFNGIDHLEASDIKEASEFMFRYVKSQFPDAHFYLKEFWASQVGKNGTYGGVYYPMQELKNQTLYTTVLKDAADRMAEKFSDIGMRVMRDGEAWQLVREAGYDQLCARLGFRPDDGDTSFNPSDPHEGDHGHDGDIGGGQYLNGALWLQTIMMNHYDADFDVREIDWIPTYTYNNKVVENRFDADLLKECAYKAATVGWESSAHTHSGEDDGSCITAVTCEICGVVMAAAADAHKDTNGDYLCDNENCNRPMESVVVEIAYAYDRQGAQIPYDQYNARRSIYASPEDATAQRTIFMDCSSYVNSIYREAFGVNIMPYEISDTNSAASPSTSKYDDYARLNSSNIDVVGYWSPLDYPTVAEREALAARIRTNLQVGDILTYRHGKTSGTSGHVYMYLGNDTFIHCAGAGSYVVNEKNPALSYDSNASEITSGGTIGTITFANIFTNQSSGRYIFKATESDTVYSFGIIRPMARGLVPTEKTVARMAIAGMSMEKTASVCENASVDSGAILTYTVTLENTSENTYSDILVKDTLPAGVEFVSSDVQGTVSGNELSWTVTVAGKTTVKINYTVKVTETTPGALIVSDQTYVSKIQLGTITHSVSCYSDSQKKLITETAIGYKDSDQFADTIALVKAVYEKLDIDLFKENTAGDILDQLIDTEGRTHRVDTKLSNMLAPNLYGGLDIRYGWLYLPSENDKTRLPKEEHLSVGDIIVADWDNTDTSKGTKGSTVYLYVGDHTLVAVENGVCKLVEIGDDIFTAGDNKLISLLGYDRYAVLRPSMVSATDTKRNADGMILNADGSFGGSLDAEKYGEGAPENGQYDVVDSDYYTVNNDFYNMTSTEQRLIIPQFASYQQTMADSSGLACVLMVLDYMGKDVENYYTELELVKKYEAINGKTVYGNGTTAKGLVKLIEGLDLGYEATNVDPDHPSGFSQDQAKEFIMQNLKDGKFVLVRYQSPVGYGWKVVVGYDNVGTVTRTTTNEVVEAFSDDVIIFAEPYDGADHKQNGYTTERMQDFHMWWKKMEKNGDITEQYSFVVIDANAKINYDLQPVDMTQKQTTYDLHLALNPDGTYGGTRDKALFGTISSGRGWWNHLHTNYYKINDFYNMGTKDTRILLTNYSVLQQTMASSCGPCAITSVLKYYGEEGSYYDWELEYVNAYERINNAVINGVGSNVVAHSKTLKEYGYTSTYSTTNAGKLPTYSTYESYMEFMRTNLEAGKPVVVGTNLGSGHFLTVIGLDDMGTDYIYDDVIIVADSSDYWDGYQDGYNTHSAKKFFDQHTNKPHTQLQNCIVIDRKS